MRINEILTEAPEYPETGRQVRAAMVGRRPIGVGVDAAVYKHPTDPNKVIKVLVGEKGKPADLAKLGFARFYKFVKAHPKNKHLPKFGKPSILYKDDKETVMQVVMERLKSVQWDDPVNVIYFNTIQQGTGKKTRQQVQAGIKTMVQYLVDTWPKMVKSRNIHATELINDLLLVYDTVRKLYKYKGSMNIDLHGGNVMQRDDGTIVISDPYIDNY